MLLRDDLELRAGYKRIQMLGVSFLLIWAFGFFTYLWITVFPLFTIPLGFLLGALPGSFSVLLWLFNVEFHTLTIIIKTPLLFNINPLILFKINPTLDLLLLAVIFGCLPPMVVIGTYQALLLRLSKDTTFRTSRFNLNVRKLPNSNRYTKYGEAKARIKHLIKKGSTREKTAIFALGVSYLGACLFIIFFIFSLFGILPLVPYLLGQTIWILSLLVVIASQRFMWNTIQ